jgi:hypothetical protein
MNAIRGRPFEHHLYSLAGFLAVEFEAMRDVATSELVRSVDRYIDAIEMDYMKSELEDDK